MEAARIVIDAERLMSVIPLPESMRQRRVEVIILPLPDNATPRLDRSMKGFLKDYADAGRTAEERGAWEKAVTEKYGSV